MNRVDNFNMIDERHNFCVRACFSPWRREILAAYAARPSSSPNTIMHSESRCGSNANADALMILPLELSHTVTWCSISFSAFEVIVTVRNCTGRQSLKSSISRLSQLVEEKLLSSRWFEWSHGRLNTVRFVKSFPSEGNPKKRHHKRWVPASRLRSFVVLATWHPIKCRASVETTAKGAHFQLIAQIPLKSG